MANRRRGQGRQNYLNGTYYIGEFNNNSRNGFGTLYLQDGTIAQVGQWDYDLFVGK